MPLFLAYLLYFVRDGVKAITRDRVFLLTLLAFTILMGALMLGPYNRYVSGTFSSVIYTVPGGWPTVFLATGGLIVVALLLRWKKSVYVYLVRHRKLPGRGRAGSPVRLLERQARVDQGQQRHPSHDEDHLAADARAGSDSGRGFHRLHPRGALAEFLRTQASHPVGPLFLDFLRESQAKGQQNYLIWAKESVPLFLPIAEKSLHLEHTAEVVGNLSAVPQTKAPTHDVVNWNVTLEIFKISPKAPPAASPPTSK